MAVYRRRRAWLYLYAGSKAADRPIAARGSVARHRILHRQLFHRLRRFLSARRSGQSLARLGVGAHLCHRRPADRHRNHSVVDIAQTDGHAAALVANIQLHACTQQSFQHGLYSGLYLSYLGTGGDAVLYARFSGLFPFPYRGASMDGRFRYYSRRRISGTTVQRAGK